MVTLITDKLRNSSLEDVTFSEFIPYQTRSKTKAFQHSLQVHPHHAVFSGNNRNGAPSLTASSSSPSSSSTQSKLLHRNNDTPPPGSGPAGIPSPGKDIPGTNDPGKHIELVNNVANDMLSITPPAPPLKRHCRSFSAGEAVENRTKGKWKPRASKIWRPVKHKPGESSHSPLPKGFSSSSAFSSFSSGFGSGAGANLTLNEYSTPPESPVPRPASATSWDGTVSAWNTFRPVLCTSPKLRSVSVSEVKLLSSESSGSFCSAGSPAGATSEEMDLHGGNSTGGQLRCRSQPCVSERKGGKKRRREEDVRPKLDLFKMEEARLPFDDWCRRSKQNADKRDSKSKPKSISNQSNQRPRRHLNNNKYKHKHSKSLTLPSESDDFMGLQTIASSPCDSKHTSSSVMITPTCSPNKELLLQESANAGVSNAGVNIETSATRRETRKAAAAAAKSKRRLPVNMQLESSDDDEDDTGSLVDDPVIFPFDADLNELDLEQIEKF